MRMLVFFMAILCACSAREAPETVIFKYTWVWCWNKCGKADTLSAVSTSSCVCSDGTIIPLQKQNFEKPEPTLMDRLLAFLKGE